MTARGNERKAIVRDDRDRQGFVDTLASMVEQYHVVCHAWVLMSNHYHLLLETPRANLSQPSVTSMGRTRKRSTAATIASATSFRGGSKPLWSRKRPTWWSCADTWY